MSYRPFALLLTLAALDAITAAAADGAVDLSFWGDGRYTDSAAPDEAYLSEIIEDPTGALVTLGGRRSISQPVQYVPRWRRLTDSNQSGCDLSLANGVRAIFAAGAFDDSGRLVLGGWAWLADDSYRLLFARYIYPSCVLDPALDGDGVLLLDVDAASVSVTALATDGDAIVFAANIQVIPTADYDGLVGRLLPSGAPDPSFSGDGLVPFDGRAGHDNLAALMLAPGGRIYVGGDGLLPDGTQSDFYLVGLTGNGSPIPGFGLDGLVLVDFDAAASDPSDAFSAFALMPDGRILLAGEAATDASPGYGGALAMVEPSGALDPDFGTGGRLIDLTRGAYRGVAAQGNGRIVIGGMSFPSTTFYISRRLASGAPDPAFAGGASVPIVFPEGGFHALQKVLLQGGRVAVAGFLERQADVDLGAVARLKNAYIFVDGFEIGSPWFWSNATL